VNERVLDVALESPSGNGNRDGRLVKLPEQEIGEGISAGSGGAPCGVGLEHKLAARELVSDLIEILPVVLEPKSERVLASDPGQFVHELQRIVVVSERTLGAVAQSGESGSAKRYARNSPSDRRPALLVRYAQARNDIGVKSQESADGVIEPGVAETGFVHEVGRKGSSVGCGILFVVRQDLRPGPVQPLGGLVFVTPTVAAHPL